MLPNAQEPVPDEPHLSMAHQRKACLFSYPRRTLLTSGQSMVPPEEDGRITMVKGCAMRGGGTSPIDRPRSSLTMVLSRKGSPVGLKSFGSTTSPADPIRKLMASR